MDKHLQRSIIQWMRREREDGKIEPNDDGEICLVYLSKVEQKSLFSTGSFGVPQSLILTDFNQDNRLDLAISNVSVKI